MTRRFIAALGLTLCGCGFGYDILRKPAGSLEKYGTWEVQTEIAQDMITAYQARGAWERFKPEIESQLSLWARKTQEEMNLLRSTGEKAVVKLRLIHYRPESNYAGWGGRAFQFVLDAVILDGATSAEVGVCRVARTQANWYHHREAFSAFTAEAIAEFVRDHSN